MSLPYDAIHVRYEQSGWGVTKTEEDADCVTNHTLTLAGHNESPEQIKEVVTKVCSDVVGFDSEGACRILRLVANWIKLQKHVKDSDISRMACVRVACEKDGDGPYLYYQWINYDEREAWQNLPDFYQEIVDAVQDDRMKLYLAAAMCSEHRSTCSPHEVQRCGDIVGLKGLLWIFANATFNRSDDGVAEIGAPGIKHISTKLTYDRKTAAMSGILPIQLYGHSNTLEIDVDDELPF